MHKKLASSLSKGDVYETQLLEQLADIEAASEFFACLDHQLNKVNQFYRIKEKEFIEKGNSAIKQLNYWIEARNLLNKNKEHASQHSIDEDSSISTYFSSGRY